MKQGIFVLRSKPREILQHKKKSADNFLNSFYKVKRYQLIITYLSAIFTYLRKKKQQNLTVYENVCSENRALQYKSAYRSNIMIFTEIVARKYRLELHFKSELFIQKTKQGSETWLKFPY